MKKLLSVCVLSLTLSVSHAVFAAETAVPNASAPQYNFLLSYEDTEDAVSQALAEKGAGAKVSAKISGNRNGPLFAYDKPISVEIRGLRFDKPSSHWAANVLFLSNDAVVSAIPVSGKFEEVAEVPVLKRGLRAGELISADDIEMREYAVSRLRQGTISDLSSLVGKSPMRIISSGRPVREDEIAKPALVKKNAVVQMRYDNGGVQISTTGQALTDGSSGQMIAVRNMTSKKTVYAVVESANEVRVKSSNMQQANVAEENLYGTN